MASGKKAVNIQWRFDRFATRADAEALRKIRIHFDEVQRFSASLNLVSAPTLAQADIVHFVDSYLALDTLDILTIQGEYADVGSGGGFPGLIAAALNPAAKYTLFERDQKKGEFLKTCAHRMGLKNCTVNTDGYPSGQIKFDGVMSRAMTTGEELARLSSQTTHVGSKLWLLKSRHWRDEEQPDCSTWNMVRALEYKLGDFGPRFVVEYSRIQ